MFFSTQTVRAILSRGIQTLTTGQRNPLIFREAFDCKKICPEQKDNMINLLLYHADALNALKNKKTYQADEAFKAAGSYLDKLPLDIIRCNTNLIRVASEVLWGRADSYICRTGTTPQGVIDDYWRLVELSPKSLERERLRDLLFVEGFLSAEEAFPEFVTQPKKPAVAGGTSPQSSCSPVNSVLKDDANVKYDPFLRVILSDDEVRPSLSF